MFTNFALGFLFFAGILQYKQANGCSNWCFATGKCYPPQPGDCTDCLKNYCGMDFYTPFQSNFASQCIFRAMKRPSQCKAVCGGVATNKLKKRRNKCNNCIRPCIEEALENPDNYCPSLYPPVPPVQQTQIPGSLPNLISQMMEGQDSHTNDTTAPVPCEVCYGNDSCPTIQELLSYPQFCLEYVALKCKAFKQHITGGTHANISTAQTWECIINAWNDSCSECPYINPDRFINCQACLETCTAALDCAVGCVLNRGMYPMVIPCDKCAALCRELGTTPQEEVDCMNQNCPDCIECDECYLACEADGYAENLCKCIWY